MHLEEIHLIQFKNFEELQVLFTDGINCITGRNGSGKTNLLDAIHYLCLTKSFLNPIDSQHIRHEQPFMVVEGKFALPASSEHIYMGLKRGQKKVFRRNKKEYEKLAQHIGQFPVVVIAPQDGLLITGGSEERRRFMDGLISQYDTVYLSHLIGYQKVLLQRNALLKSFYEERRWDTLTLEILNEQLCQFGQPIQEKRRDFIREFLPVFENYYAEIAGVQEVPGLKYASRWMENMPLAEALKLSEDKDRITTYTTEGPHREDWEFQLAGHPIKKFGSQGQQKSYLVGLKLAEHHFLKQHCGTSPILLLDDIFDKMDHHRVGRLISCISEPGFGQVFITDTGTEYILPIFDQGKVPYNLIEIEHQKIQRDYAEGSIDPVDASLEGG